MGGFYVLFSFSRVRRDLSFIDQIHAIMASENRQLIFNRWKNFIPPKKKNNFGACTKLEKNKSVSQYNLSLQKDTLIDISQISQNIPKSTPSMHSTKVRQTHAPQFSSSAPVHTLIRKERLFLPNDLKKNSWQPYL